MKRWRGIALAAALGLFGGFNAAAKADDLSIWLTEPLVAIDSGFAGARIFVFGGVRPRAEAGGAPDGVVVAVRGPAEDVPVRPKRRIGVFWIAGEPLVAKDAPAYYFVGGTSPLGELVEDEERARRQLGAEHLKIAFAAPPAASLEKIENRSAAELKAASEPFRDALLSQRATAGLYVQASDAVEWKDGSLFRAAIDLPANTPVGAYQVDVHVARDGRIVASRSTPLYVDKVGLERQIYNLAHDFSLVYGLLCVAVSLFAGWLASLIFKR